MEKRAGANNALLTGANARSDDVDQPWEQDNQAWWDWYVSLAHEEPTAQESVPDHEQVSVVPSSLPDDETLFAELQTPYELSEAAIRDFRANGFVKLPGVLTAGATARLRLEMRRLLETAFDTTLDGGVRQRFLSLEMAWLDEPLIRRFVLSPRIAGISAGLLGVPAVRLYHDNLMSKEPDCGRTPWHFDDHHFPLATQEVVTAWIPAQPIPRAMGPLAFAAPIDAWRLVEHVSFSKFDTSYDRRVGEIFRERGVRIEDGPFAAGEVSFHHNLCFHTAAANRTGLSRLVLANTYYVDGARVVDQPTMVSGDWQKFIPDTAPGETAASPNNPVCWPAPPRQE